MYNNKNEIDEPFLPLTAWAAFGVMTMTGSAAILVGMNQKAMLDRSINQTLSIEFESKGKLETGERFTPDGKEFVVVQTLQMTSTQACAKVWTPHSSDHSKPYREHKAFCVKHQRATAPGL